MDIEATLREAEELGIDPALIAAVRKTAPSQWNEDRPVVTPELTNAANAGELESLFTEAAEAGIPTETIDKYRQTLLQPYREQLEVEQGQRIGQQNVADRALEAAEDTVAENLYEGAGQIAAGANSVVLDVMDLVTSPMRYAYREATGKPISVRDAFGDYDPGEANFVEEPVVRDALFTIGQVVGASAGFAPVTRDPAKVQSAFYDIMGVGMTETPGITEIGWQARRALDIRTGQTNAVDITTDKGVLEVITDAAHRIEIEANRHLFDDFEATQAKIPAWQEKVDALQEQWTKAVTKLEEANASGAGIEAAEAKVAKVIDKMTKLKAEDPRLVGPNLDKGGLARYNAKRTAALDELERLGVSRSYTNEVIQKNGLFKPAGFQELIDYDATMHTKYYDGDGKGLTGFAKVFRPASGVMRSRVGAVPAAKFERAFESAAREQEQLSITFSRDEAALTELAAFAESPAIKAKFLDLRFDKNLISVINDEARRVLSPAARDMWNELLAASRRHQSRSRKVYKDDVTIDDLFWASQKKAASQGDLSTEQYIPGTATARSSVESNKTVDRVVSSLDRNRNRASMMSQSQLDEYANPILEQIKRINQEQAYVHLAENFGMRKSIGLGGDSKQFFQVFEDTVGRQSGNKNMAATARKITEGTYIGTTVRPPTAVELFMKQAYGGTLGQLDSALLNLHDVFVSMLKSGVRPTLQAILDNEGMDIRTLGIGGDVKSLGEFQQSFDLAIERGTVAKLADGYQNFTFSVSGFRIMDRAGKGIIMRAALNKARAAAKGGRLEREFGYMMDYNELAQINKYLAAGTPLEQIPSKQLKLVEELMFARLGEQQLISAAGRPLYYMEHPYMRWAYALSGFAIKQTELLKVGVYDQLKRGNYAKAGEFMAGYMIFSAGGYALINNIRGMGQWYLGDETREPTAERFIANIIEQPVAALTMNRLGNPYSNSKFKQDPVGFLGESVIPPIGFIGNAAKDISLAFQRKDPQYYVLNSIPYGDEFRAWLVK